MPKALPAETNIRSITQPEADDPAPATGRHAGAFRAMSMVAGLPLFASCSGIQSALDPAGDEAALVATLFWIMTIGSAVIWAFVVLLSLYASRWKRRPISETAAGKIIIWGGVIFPVVVLTGLLTYALWLMPSLRPFAGGERAALRVEVVGHQFWWHVVYHREDGAQVVSANELRLPVGERVEFSLSSADMIHSFWIPTLGGKMDLVPGRVNRLSLRATRVGMYRGQCAEFCGASHALMAFPAIVMEPAEFASWLNARSRPSAGVDVDPASRDLFLAEDCGRCHRVNGTRARGITGPDLSHVGSRLNIAAGLLANDTDALTQFVAHSAAIKPGSHMPAYPELSADELDRLAAWLKDLQ